MKYCVETKFCNIIIFSCRESIFEKEVASCEGDYKWIHCSV